jgi:hypothetical protein
MITVAVDNFPLGQSIEMLIHNGVYETRFSLTVFSPKF